jgi:hypothetical protein
MGWERILGQRAGLIGDTERWQSRIFKFQWIISVFVSDHSPYLETMPSVFDRCQSFLASLCLSDYFCLLTQCPSPCQALSSIFVSLLISLQSSSLREASVSNGLQHPNSNSSTTTQHLCTYPFLKLDTTIIYGVTSTADFFFLPCIQSSEDSQVVALQN